MKNKLRKYGITDEAYRQNREAGLRWCWNCQKFLPATSFYSPKSSTCIECRKLLDKTNGKRREPNLESIRRSILRRTYNVTPEWFDEKLQKQSGVCAICGGTEKRRLSIDHNHRINKARGLLCTKCNVALERIENIEDWASKALSYLQTYES